MVRFDDTTWTLIALIGVLALFAAMFVQTHHAQQERKIYDLRRRVYDLRKAHAQRMAEMAAREREAKELAQAEPPETAAA